MPLGTLRHQGLFCGCIYIEKAVDFYRSPSLHTHPGNGLVPDSDWRAFCILETTEDNHGMPQKLSGGREGKQNPKLNPWRQVETFNRVGRWRLYNQSCVIKDATLELPKSCFLMRPEQYLWQYCQCPKRRGGQGTARGAVMQQQLGASPFLLLVCGERTRGCDCSASADPKEGLNSWSRVLGQEEAAPGPAELSIPPPTAHCRAPSHCWAGSWQGGRCWLEALPLGSAAGNGELSRALAIQYSASKFILLFLFFSPQYLMYRLVWEKTRDANQWLLVTWRQISFLCSVRSSQQTASLKTKSSFVEILLTLSTNCTIWLPLVLNRLIIPDTGLTSLLRLPVLHRCYTFPMSTGTLSVMIWNL